MAFLWDIFLCWECTGLILKRFWKFLKGGCRRLTGCHLVSGCCIWVWLLLWWVSGHVLKHLLIVLLIKTIWQICCGCDKTAHLFFFWTAICIPTHVGFVYLPVHFMAGANSFHIILQKCFLGEGSQTKTIPYFVGYMNGPPWETTTSNF